MLFQTLTPEQIDEITSILEPIKDLQNAVLELNDALRLDVPEIDTCKSNYTFHLYFYRAKIT